MNILVVGATGDVGSEAAKACIEKGFHVRCLVRAASNRQKLGNVESHVAFVDGDMLQPASLKTALDCIEGVIVSIRLNAAEQSKGRSYDDVELQGVLNVIEEAKRRGVKKIIHVSADGVGPECVSDMYRAKYRAEEAIRSSGIDYTIFKPSGMFKDFLFFHIPNVLKLGETGTWPYGPIDFHMSPLSHKDLACCMADALHLEGTSQLTLPIGGPECMTQGDLLNRIAREAGIKAVYTRGVPKEQLIEMARSSPDKKFFTPEQLHDFIIDSCIDHGPVRRLFDRTFQTVESFLKEAVPQVRKAMKA